MAASDPIVSWSAFELERRLQRADTLDEKAAVWRDADRARRDPEFRARLAEIAQKGRFQSGGWGAAQLGLAGATMAPMLPVVGAALGPVGILGGLGLAGLGALNIKEGLQRRAEGLPGAKMQMGVGALDVGLPFAGRATRLLRGLKGAKPVTAEAAKVGAFIPSPAPAAPQAAPRSLIDNLLRRPVTPTLQPPKPSALTVPTSVQSQRYRAPRISEMDGERVPGMPTADWAGTPAAGAFLRRPVPLSVRTGPNIDRPLTRLGGLGGGRPPGLPESLPRLGRVQPRRPTPTTPPGPATPSQPVPAPAPLEAPVVSTASVRPPVTTPPSPTAATATATGAPVQPGPSVLNIIDDIGAGYASGKTAAGRPLKNIALRLATLGWARRAVENLDPKALQALSRGEETGLSQQFWGGLTGEEAGLGGARLFGHRDVALGRPVRGAPRTAFTALEGGLPSRNVVERFLEGARQTEYGNEGKEALALLNRWIKEDTAVGKNIAKMMGFRNRAGNLVVDVRTTVKNGGGRTAQYLPAKQAQAYVVIRERARVLREILETIVKGRKGVELKEFGRGRALGVGEETLEAGVDQFLRLGSATDQKKLLDAMNKHAQQIAILVASIMGAEQLLPQGGARAAGG